MRSVALKAGVIVLAIQFEQLVGEEKQSAPTRPQNVYIELLKTYKIQPTRASLENYFESIVIDSRTQKRMQALISQLGDATFKRRQAAMFELIRLPRIPRKHLEHATQSADAEIRWRAGRVLRESENRVDDILSAALFVVRQRRLKGLTRQLLAILPLCDRADLRLAAREALKATAQSTDGQLLKKTLESEDVLICVTAIVVLDHVLGKRADATFEKLLTDNRDAVRGAVALALANRGTRSALPVLVDLLQSQDRLLRFRAVQTLRGLTGQHQKFVVYAKKEDRANAMQAWKQWVAEHGRTAKLTVPPKHGQVFLGRTLLTNYAAGRVEEIGVSGERLWSIEVAGAFACQGLPNGHRLISSYSNNTIREYDAAGEIVWEIVNAPKQPYSVRRLLNGNTLVSAYGSKKLVEYSPEKKIVWQVQLTRMPTDAVRLENGDTLVSVSTDTRVNGRVIKIDATGKVIWESAELVRPMSVESLANGNILVCDHGAGRVVELNLKSKEVWVADGFLNPYDAQRLPNGNTLLTDGRGAHEIDRSGKVIWKREDH